MQIEPFGGWSHCARFRSRDTELFVTLEVGPRIIKFGFCDGPNEFAAYEKHAGICGGTDYRSYGGHRVWVAPEIPSVTYEPDNEPVEIEDVADGKAFFSLIGRSGLRKGLSVGVDEQTGVWKVDHIVENHGSSPARLAPWAITVMEPGGTCIWPQAKPRPHPDALLPVRAVALWAYTDMSDPRWSWGRKLVRLHQSSVASPQKAGAFVEQGYAAYFNHGNIFIKRFDACPNMVYPDFGCNFEAFTRHDMLEVESLGPLVDLGPGERTVHRETWRLIRNQELLDEEDACLELLENLAYF